MAINVAALVVNIIASARDCTYHIQLLPAMNINIMCKKQSLVLKTFLYLSNDSSYCYWFTIIKWISIYCDMIFSRASFVTALRTQCFDGYRVRSCVAPFLTARTRKRTSSLDSVKVGY